MTQQHCDLMLRSLHSQKSAFTVERYLDVQVFRYAYLIFIWASVQQCYVLVSITVPLLCP